MDLTKNFVKAKRPCAEGFRWFLRTHQNGGDYQPLLDALVRDGRVDDACWLLTQFGHTDAVLSVNAIDAQAIVFAGTLEVRGNIEVDSILRAGGSIRAGGGIRAGQSIIAGEESGLTATSVRAERSTPAETSRLAGASRPKARCNVVATCVPSGICPAAAC